LSPGDIVLVAAAGLACGVINTVAGGGSLILFPALLATGMPTLAANVTNSLGTRPGYLGGDVGFPREIDELRHHLRPFLVATILGSTTGCVLLLVTPGDTFDVIVPWLVIFAALLTAVQPEVKRRALASGRVDGGSPGMLSIGAVFLATIYGGYFGAALGVILIGVLGLTIHETMQRVTALKTVLSLLDATVSVVIFGLFGPVRWVAVAVAAPTTLIGGYLGAAVARRLDENVLRASVVAFGIAVGIYLFFR
jgi:uncharacterized membrane protein YfcA